ncbi:MAG: cysteine--tRNA ligase [SAR202 cluster bacterium]|nr:cysteine--tRNA ligase [SAR202 cluster bacterium]
MKLYNTLSGQVEEFVPEHEPITLYVCGITPYAPAHVGHAMRAVIFDVLRRYLEFRGHRVRHVENFTDVDDKMIDSAAKMGITVPELADRNIKRYLSEMAALNVLRAHIYPRATREMPKILDLISGLIERGYAYATGGDVYFRVTKDDDYGKLSKRSRDSMMAGARVEINEKKEDPMDFALWKAKKPGEPSWNSPWGEGRPGWHIECSAMSIAYLGETIDIHGGGADLIFPHHENEIAQSESYTGKVPFARFWMHNGLLRLGEDKMSKSLGNIVPVGDALEQYSTDALRLFFISSHYRSPLAYGDDNIVAQERAVERLRNAATLEGIESNGPALDAKPYRERFIAAMDEDLNTPRAIAVLFDLARDIQRGRDQKADVSSAIAALQELAGILGLTLAQPAAQASADAAPFIELLIETRKGLRAAKQFTLADTIRDRLAELGVVLEDSAGGTQWKQRRS